MQELERLISQSPAWVYAALFAYAFLKTGPLPIFAGYASTLGWLDALPAFTAVWSGAVLGDLVRFEMGRRLGPATLRRFPRWEPRAAAVARVMSRHYLWICLFKRFAKGLRTPISLACGLSTLTRMRFAVVTVVTAAIWSGSFVGFGVVAGAVVERAPRAWLGMAGLGAMIGILVVLTWLVHRELRRVTEIPAAGRPATHRHRGHPFGMLKFIR